MSENVRYEVKYEKDGLKFYSNESFEEYVGALALYEELLKSGNYDTLSIVEVTEIEIKHCRDGMDEY
jgi:hypothetical protein